MESETGDTAGRTLTGAEISRMAQDSLDGDKAENVTVIDLRGKTSFADTMIVASGRSGKHVSAIAENLHQTLKDHGVSPLAMEGQEQADWVLIDAGDVLVHVFRPEVREFYNLERMWAGPAEAGEGAADAVSA